jgi:hypothetical protein
MKFRLVQKAMRLSVYLFPLFLGLVSQCGIKKPVFTHDLQEGPHSHLHKDNNTDKKATEGSPK